MKNPVLRDALAKGPAADSGKIFKRAIMLCMIALLKKTPPAGPSRSQLKPVL
jgi:hypothetical protein